MSVDTIAIVISTATMLLGFFGAFGWMIRRSDAQHDRLGGRIDTVEAKLVARIGEVETKLGARIDGVERELVEVKIAVARIEGPPRHLLSAR
ncbi:hypothetical protein [Microbacterium sp. 18062]|uniref:hypothetical protein n=1 Tax=Microbacterium sp. 18062 TaxID=2681410 RepID=UPI0013570745|nr:hypothetical protein [Microbacterium sp. 18062]